MEAEIFVVCDNAQNYQNKMVVVGPFNVIHAESCPFVHPSFSLACRFNLSSSDTTGTKNIEITFLNEKGESFLPPMEDSMTIRDNTENSHLNLVIGFCNVKFESFGKYYIRVAIDDFSRELCLDIKQKAVNH